MSFQNLKLIEPLLKALSNEGYTTPTPIQEQSIPIILNRKDLLGCAQTGTGKTAAFAIPILQILHEEAKNHSANAAKDAGMSKSEALPNTTTAAHRIPIRTAATRQAALPIKALILTPTRELAIQIDESFANYGKYAGLRHLVIFGGVPQNPQVQALQRGVDILVATPGRLLDLMDQRYINLQEIQIFVLDEADRMLDMGFVHDVKKIITRLPQKRQTLFFSATMPPEIQKLASTILVNPEKVEVTPVSSTAETIQQSIYFVERQDKKSLLLHILNEQSIPTALVFTRTKHGADKVAQGLSRAGIRAEAIHGNKSQNARQRALLNFKSRQTRILVATDIAARGIDIDELTHVINFELPNVPETYVHRIGRTGRAGASGIAISFCDAEEKEYLRDIQKLISRPIPVAEEHPFAAPTTFFQQRQPASRQQTGNGRQSSGNGRQSSGNGRQSSGNGRQSSGNGRQSSDNGRQPSDNGRQPSDSGLQSGENSRPASGDRRPPAPGNQRNSKPPIKKIRQPSFQVQSLQERTRQHASQQSDLQMDLDADFQAGLHSDPYSGHQQSGSESGRNSGSKRPAPHSVVKRTEQQQAAPKQSAHQRPPAHTEEGYQSSGLPIPVNQIAGDERL